MYQKNVTIQNETGLHARPASDFVKRAAKYTSKITIQRADEAEKYNAKSIIMLLSLGLSKGEQAKISAEGEDEQAAVDDLVNLVANELKD
ncbi:MAG: HPr family phosphocarrier protein [Oscillospiraceae bacterium]|nr:HPr family phosphocarrier protein [Oscillospiraceae bacterium]